MAERKMCDMKMAVVMVLGLLAVVVQSARISPNNLKDTKYFGVIANADSVDIAFKEAFAQTANVTINGINFIIGKVNWTDVVYAKTLTKPSAHGSLTAQLMAQYFELHGIIHAGLAAARYDDSSMRIGYVTVPQSVAFTGSWEWLAVDYPSEKDKLVISDYSPENCKNSLASIKFQEIEILYKGDVINSYWILPSSTWLSYAEIMEVNAKVVYGLNSSSSDIIVYNPHYADFLYCTFGASTFDTSTATVGLAAKLNGLRFISFQGISNFVTLPPSDHEKKLAAKNVVNVVFRFIWQASVPRYVKDA